MQIAEAFVVIRPETTTFFGELRAKFGGLSGDIAKLGAGLGVGLIGAAGVAVKMAANFQTIMERLHTQAGVAQSSIGGLSAGVLKLAGQVAQSPDSLAEALYHIESSFASLGITGPRALNLLKVAAEGARIGGADIVDVTNALDAAVAAGIPGVQNFSQAMGALNAVVGAGDMKMQDLANALGTGVLAAVKGFGVTLADAGAALATFGDNNIRGALAGNTLRTAIQALAHPVRGGEQVLKDLGIASGESEKALHKIGLTTDGLAKDLQTGGLNKAITDLHDRIQAAGISSNQTGNLIVQAFGRKAGTGIDILLGQFDRFESKYKDIAKGAGSFGDAWQHTTETFNFQLKSLESSAQALGIRLGNVLLPYATAFLKMLTTVGQDLGQVFGPILRGVFRDLSDLGAQVESAMSAGLTTAKQLLGYFRVPDATNFDAGVRGGLERISSRLGGLVGEAKVDVGRLIGYFKSPDATNFDTGISGSVERLASKLGGLPSVVAGKLKDIGAPIIAAIGTSLVTGHWDGVAGAISTSISTAVRNIRTGVLDVSGWVGDAIAHLNLAGSLGRLNTHGLGQSIGQIIARALNDIGGVAGTITTAIGNIFAHVDWVGIGLALGRQVPALLVGLAAGILNFDLGGLLKGLAKHWQDVLFAVIAVAFAPARLLGKVSELLGKVPLAGRLLAWAFDHFVVFSKGLRSLVEDALSNMGRAFVDGLTHQFPRMSRALSGGLGRLVAAVVGFGETMFLRALYAVDALGNAIVTRAPAAVGRGLASLVGSLARLTGDVVAAFVRAGDRMTGGMLSGLADGFVGVLRWLGGLPGAIIGAIGDFGSLLYNAGSSIIGGLIRGIQDSLGPLGNVLGSVGKFIKDHKGPPEYDAVMLRPAGQAIIGGLIDGINDGLPNLGRTLGGITAGIGAPSLTLPAGAPAGGGRSYVQHNTINQSVGLNADQVGRATALALRRLDLIHGPS